jgi:hypothetical protein
MARTITLTLRPSRTIALSLNSSDQGCLGFAAPTKAAVMEMVPFFKGDKGDKGDAGEVGSGQCFTMDVTAEHIATKQLTLPSLPRSEVLVHIVSGTAQKQNVDFTVSGLILSWASLSLELILDAGDCLSITYF